MATMPPMLRRHLLAEQKYAAAMLGPLDQRRAAMADSMITRLGAGSDDPGLRHGNWTYRRYMPSQGLHAVYARSRSGGTTEEILLDEGLRAKDHPYYRAVAHQTSPDHRYFAWAEDVLGNDRHRICVRDTASGRISIIVPADALGTGGLVFSPSSRWLFWIERDAFNRPSRLLRVPVSGGSSVAVYHERDPAIFMQVRRSAAGRYLILSLFGPDIAEVRLIPAADETAEPRVVSPRRDGVRYEIDEWQDRLLLLTNADGAFDRRLVAMSPDRYVAGPVLVPHRPGCEILEIHPFRDALVRIERADALHRIVIRSVSGEDHIIPFPGAAFTLAVPPDQDYAADHVRVIYQAPDSPKQWFDVSLSDGKQTLVKKESLARFNPENYAVERLWATAPDGETIPITVLSRRDAPRDGSVPLLLYGYGAYGISAEAEFSLPATVLVDQGWRYAIAHVRGGSEKGRRWFLNGRRFAKRNSFTDFIACASHLCDQSYTRRGRIVAYGLSAGGLLVGASVNMAPAMWGGIIAQVPFVDMLNTMSDPSHPLVPLLRPDWGDPLSDPLAYDYIASISPYENVQAASYPPLLCTAGLKDDRVAYWEPAKLVAAVRRHSTSGKPAILLLDAESGHQTTGGRRKEFDQAALFWAFAEQCVSVEELS